MHDEISSIEAGEEEWEKGDGKKQTWMHRDVHTCMNVHGHTLHTVYMYL